MSDTEREQTRPEITGDDGLLRVSSAAPLSRITVFSYLFGPIPEGRYSDLPTSVLNADMSITVCRTTACSARQLPYIIAWMDKYQSDLPALQVVGLGLATVDVLVRLKEMPTWSRELGPPISGFRLDGGGPVSTAMVAAARLGASVGYVGTAGADEAADLKLRSMAESDIDLSHMVRTPYPERQVVVVHVHSESGERIFAPMEGLEEQTLGVDDLDREYITGAEYLHLDGFHFEAALQAARWMKEAGKTVVLDASSTSGAGSERLMTLIKNVDVLITGGGFAKVLTGISDIWKAGDAVLEMGANIMVETVGDKGCYTITPTERFHTPAYPVDVLDTTGAGDVFHGAYIVGLLHGWDLSQIAQFSSAAAALNCTKLGGRAGIPDTEELMRFMRVRGTKFDLGRNTQEFRT